MKKCLTASHFDFAPINHRTSALGQWATALCSRASKDSLIKNTLKLKIYYIIYLKTNINIFT